MLDIVDLEPRSAKAIGTPQPAFILVLESLFEWPGAILFIFILVGGFFHPPCDERRYQSGKPPYP